MLSPKSLLAGRDVRREVDWGMNAEDSKNSVRDMGQASYKTISVLNDSESSSLLEDCTVRGAFECGGDLSVNGFLEGDLSVGGLLVVGVTGIVRANCRARSAKVYGKVVGDLICSEKIEIMAGAEIRGNIKTKRLSIEDGVVFDGRVEMPAPESSSKEDLLDLQMDAILGHEGVQ
jgi:cytoskeletal protein CcmA (bactofilin family)